MVWSCVAPAAYGQPRAPGHETGTQLTLGKPAEGEADAAAPSTADVTQVLGDSLFGGDALTSERAIIALRRLHEPSLRPFFSQMAGLISTGSGEEGPDEPNLASPLRRHGILGLAELSEPARIDLLLVKTIADRDERAALLREAIDLKLITMDDLREVSRWPDLRPLVRARTLGQLVCDGERVEAFRLRELLGEDSIASVYASLLLLEVGGGREGVAGLHVGDRAPLERLVARQVHAEPEIEVLVSDIRRFDLQSGRPILEKLATEAGTPAVLRFEAIRTLLSIAPEDPEVCAAWRAALEHSPDAAARARLALAALEVARERRFGGAGSPRTFGGEVFSTLRGSGDELLIAMAEAGGTVAAHPRGAALDLAPLLALVRQGHEPSAAWVLEVAQDLPAEDATVLELEVLQTGRRSMREGYFVGAVVEAAALLAATEPARLEAMLREAAGSAGPLFTRAALSGALRTMAPARAESAAGESGAGWSAPVAWPDETCTAMATLLRVRQDGGRSPEEYGPLASIAMGRGDLNEGLRVQAAWLALLSRDEGRSALARIMAEAPE